MRIIKTMLMIIGGCTIIAFTVLTAITLWVNHKYGDEMDGESYGDTLMEA